MIHSRAKGKRGELEACRALEAVTVVRWERTAQSCGKWAADVWAPEMARAIHVEVKLYGARLSQLTKRVQRTTDLYLTGDGLLVTTLERWPRVMQARDTAFPETADPYGRGNKKQGSSNLLAGFMRQAVRDAGDGEVPVVLFRQDHLPWLVCWRHADDDALAERMEGVWRAP